MKRMLARALTALTLTPVLAAGVATGAQATESVTVPGCFGAGNTIVCAVTVTVGVPAGVGTYETTVPVCVVICTDVPVTLVSTNPGDPLQVCVSWKDRAGNPAGNSCVTQSTVNGVVQLVADAADVWADWAGDLGADVVQGLYESCYWSEPRCPGVVMNVLNYLEDRLRDL